MKKTHFGQQKKIKKNNFLNNYTIYEQLYFDGVDDRVVTA